MLKFKVPKVESTIILTLRKVYKILLTKIGFRATSKVKFSSRGNLNHYFGLNYVLPFTNILPLLCKQYNKRHLKGVN